MGQIDLTDNLIKNVRVVAWKRVGVKVLFLLTQEHSGYFTLPGGCKDLEDINLIATLHREFREELDLEPDDYSVTDTDIRKEYENLYDSPSERAGKKTIVSVFIVSNLTKEPQASSEIKDIAWLTADKALAAFNTPHMKELFQMAIVGL